MASLLGYIPLFVGLLLMLAGVPAFIKLFELTQNVTTSVILTLVYELVVVIGGFLTKVWQRVETKWADRLGDWIDLSMQALFSGYRNRYLEYLTYQHRSFDVKGLGTQGPYNLDLETIYVQLSVDPNSAHGVSSNPIQNLPEKLQSGSHTIWQYLYENNTQGNNYAILGAPGSGKTTLLKHMALTLSGPARRRKILGAPNRLPILLFLRDHADVIIENSSIQLSDLIQEQFKNRQAPIPPAGWLEKQLEVGNCLIMLDGLDEVKENKRAQVVAWVEKSMVAHAKNRFVLTSRPHGYKSTPLSHVTVLQVRSFNTQQVEQFITNWYLANEIMSTQRDDPGVREDARRGASDLISRIRSTEKLADLSVNPLLLTMIATVHRYRSSLPGRRVELYAEIFEVFLGKRQMARGLALDLTPTQKVRVLRQLAYAMMEKEIRVIDRKSALQIIAAPLSAVSPGTSGESFLEDVENSSGLLVEFESGEYSFSHLTFQEYMASVHTIDARLEDDLLKRVTNSWWNETIRLYCAQADASSIIKTCLKSSNVNALSLAIECMDEAREVDPETRKQYEDVLEKGVEDANPERRKLIATAWLKRRTG